MTRLANLDRSAHQGLRVLEERAFASCKDASMCLVTINEIPRLIVEYPVVFTKSSNASEYVCVALFGAAPDQNVFWREGRWTSFFMPLNVARQPFSVGVANKLDGDDGAKELVACIDLDNDAVQANAGEALFDARGEYSPYLKHKMTLLAELVDGEQRTRAFTTRLSELGLIHPIQLELKIPGQESRTITGLYSIDEPKLRALDATVVTELNGRGYLHAMYAMLSSLGHLQMFARRALPAPATSIAHA
jgi:SapC